MSETFDPYRKWLGIPPHEQPPNHYRLLGIGVFETDLDVIQEAADRQMAHVQTHKNGRHSDLSQQLLNELTAAKLCLLNPQRRANYDDALRRQQAQQAAKASASALAKATPVAAAPASAAPTPARPVAAAPTHTAAQTAVEDFTTSSGPTKRAARPRAGTAANKQKINPLLVLIPTIVVAVGLLYAIVSKVNSNSAADAARDAAAQKANQDIDRKNKELIAAHANKAKPGPPKEFSRPASRNTDDESDNPLTPADDGIPTEEPEPQPVLPPPVMSPEQIGELPSGGATQAVALAPNGARAITGGRDGSVRVWDMENKAELRRLEGHEGFINAVAFFPDSRRAVTAAHDGSVRLYDTETGNQLWSYVNIRLPMTSVAVSEDSRFIVAGGHQKIVHIWDVAKKTELPQWSGLPEHIYGVGIAPDGRRVFAACGGYWKRGKPDSGDDYKLHMLEVASKKQSDLPGHEACIWTLAVSADGRRAATGCFDGTIRIWNVLGASTQQILKGHTGSVWSVAFSKDGRRLLSGGDDRTVRLWNVDTGKELKKLTGHSGAATCVSITADGSIGLSGGSDGMARIWKLGEPSAAPIAKPPVESTAKNDGGNNNPDETATTDDSMPDDPVAAVAPGGKLPDFFEQPAAQGDPIPEESDQQEALKLVRQIFADDYKAAHKPQEKIALAEKLLEQAEQSSTPAERYVLYSEARSKARDSASPELMIQVVEKMGGHFAINIYDELADSLSQLARESSLPSVNKELAEKIQPLAEKAIANERYDVARRLLGTAFAAAGKTNDKTLAKQIKARGQEIVDIKKHYDAAKAAADALKTNPQDATASYTLGRYLAFDKEDWNSGLPLLAAGDNDSLKQIAAQELNAPAKAEDQVKLADAWWALAEAGDAKDKSKLQSRAEHWYRNAEPSLKGLTQTKVQKRLAELEESRPKLATKTPASPADVATTSSPSKNPTAIASAKPDKEKPVTTAAMAASVRALTGRMKGIARKKLTLTHSAVVGSTTNYGQPFEEVPGMLLVGFHYTLSSNNYLSSLQPIYLGPKGQTLGTNYGFPNGASQQILAKPGYAIGAIRGQGSYNIFGFEVEFMKVDAKGNLESGESYTHPWQGRRYTGDPTVTLGGDGQPIIGIYGKLNSQQFQSLGVVQPPADAK